MIEDTYLSITLFYKKFKCWFCHHLLRSNKRNRRDQTLLPARFFYKHGWRKSGAAIMHQPKKGSDTTRAAFGERKKTTTVRLKDLNPALFREFATECVELAQSTQSPERRALFLEMSSMWQQMAQRWDENG